MGHYNAIEAFLTIRGNNIGVTWGEHNFARGIECDVRPRPRTVVYWAIKVYAREHGSSE